MLLLDGVANGENRNAWLPFVAHMVQWRERNRSKAFSSAAECADGHLDHEVIKDKVVDPVREAIDVALETIVRMHNVMEPAFQRCKSECPGGVVGTSYDNFPNFLSFFKSLIPPSALNGLPCTRSKLSKYQPVALNSVADAPPSV